MANISLIAAVDEQNGMGKNNQLLCHLPSDLKYFKAQTIGKPIIMGRKTFESIGKALPGRVNIVLTRTVKEIEGVLIVDSLKEALRVTKDVPEVMIIGGADVFLQAMPLAQHIYLTRIHHTFEADVFFPILDPNTWMLKDSTHQEANEHNAFALTFCRYERAPVATIK